MQHANCLCNRNSGENTEECSISYLSQLLEEGWMEGKMDGSSKGRGDGASECKPLLSVFLHTSAAGGQGCAQATASQLPNSLSNLLVGFELQPPPYRYWILRAVVDIQIGAALTLAPLFKNGWRGEWRWQHGNHIFSCIHWN